MKAIRNTVRRHVHDFWPDRKVVERPWEGRPVGEWLEALDIFEIEVPDGLVVYVTGGASAIPRSGARSEFLIVAPTEDEIHREHLAMIANFHADKTLAPLEPGRIIHIGRPWVANSRCDHFVVSLPYLQGPDFEWCSLGEDERIRFLWLTPISRAEADYAREHGLEALEALLEEREAVITEPLRASVVCAGDHSALQ